MYEFSKGLILSFRALFRPHQKAKGLANPSQTESREIPDSQGMEGTMARTLHDGTKVQRTSGSAAQMENVEPSFDIYFTENRFSK